MADIAADFDRLAGYCADDVVATHRVLGQVFQQFRFSCPHPVTFAGMLEMGRALLPVDEVLDEVFFQTTKKKRKKN